VSFGSEEAVMGVWVCLHCGVFKHKGWWFQCAACGYAPEDPEELTKQLLAHADSVTPRLEEMARKVKAGEPVEFSSEEVRANLTTKAEVLEGIRMGEAMERKECPDCGKSIHYVLDGLSCGWVCQACNWGLWTTNQEALERLPPGPSINP
jgi:NMD protein affecting ribosome stability and mRNA decay